MVSVTVTRAEPRNTIVSNKEKWLKMSKNKKFGSISKYIDSINYQFYEYSLYYIRMTYQNIWPRSTCPGSAPGAAAFPGGKPKGTDLKAASPGPHHS